jgi:hypothetical protein
VISESLADGAAADDLAAELAVKLDWSKSEALEFVENVRSRMVDEYLNSPQGEQALRQAKKDQGARHMLFGGLWMVGGAVVSLITYQAASGGGTYFVFWGAVVWGAIDFIKGFAEWSSNQ